MEMTKMCWNNPAVEVQQFVPQYCQTPCGDGETMVTYYFQCDGDRGSYIWMETNGTPGLQAKTTTNIFGREQGVWNRTDNLYDFTWASRESNWGTFTPCGQTHQVTVSKGTSIDDVFPLGWESQYTTGRNASQVRIWTAGGTNTHVTAQLTTDEFTPHFSHS